MTSPRIALTHIYSRNSAGDGLLADLSVARLERAGVPRDRVTLVALDGRSFSAMANVIEVGTPTRRADLRGLRAGAEVVTTALGRGLQRRLRRFDAIVGVGGGYLIGDMPRSTVGTYLNHLPQLMAAARAGRPTAYLPIGIGPFSRLHAGRIATQLSHIDLVCVRDDPSMQYLQGHHRAHRIPDLAVLDIAESGRSPSRPGGRIAISARELGNNPQYEARIRRLGELIPDAIWAVQVEGVGSKSDRLFYERLGFEPGGSMHEVLESGEVSSLISVRLHGALAAIHRGIPAIHVSYGTKGWGAYGDLGIGDHVFDAADFDPDDLAGKARRLGADPSDFWDRVAAERPHLEERSRTLTRLLASVLGTDQGQKE